MQPLEETAAEPVRVVLDAPTSSSYARQSSHFSSFRSLTRDENHLGKSITRRRKLIRDILKQSTGRAGRLTVIDFAEAEFIEFDESGRRATGVCVRRIDTGALEFHQPSGGGELVLCAGVFESPRLLRASLLRRYDEVRSFHENADIQRDHTKVPANLRGTLWDPAVFNLLGSSLQDHLLVPLMFIASQRWVSPASSSSGGPSNGIHGWVYLDDDGHPSDLHSSHSIPR